MHGRQKKCSTQQTNSSGPEDRNLLNSPLPKHNLIFDLRGRKTCLTTQAASGPQFPASRALSAPEDRHQLSRRLPADQQSPVSEPQRDGLEGRKGDTGEVGGCGLADCSDSRRPDGVFEIKEAVNCPV